MRLKNIIPPLVLLVFVLVLIVALFSRNSINDQLSAMLKEQLQSEVEESVSHSKDSLYNYRKNGLEFELTFLEFGAENCSACRRMVKVMEKTKEIYGKTINVVFLDAMIPKNQELMKYYGVVSIPTQVLLDNEGEEYFRHSGYISFSDLEKKFFQD